MSEIEHIDEKYSVFLLCQEIIDEYLKKYIKNIKIKTKIKY